MKKQRLSDEEPAVVSITSRADVLAGRVPDHETKSKPRDIEFNLMLSPQESIMWLRSERSNRDRTED